jgi:hypothetical protein
VSRIARSRFRPRAVACISVWQDFEFTAPNEVAPEQRCGKVMFSDMHVSGGPGAGDYPTSCTGDLQLTPQEKALAFMLFDLASCIGAAL